MEFSYKSYIKLIENIKNTGYEIAGYHDWETKQFPCVLRHDVDFSLQRAYDFADMERSNGILSTYFVLLVTDMYNALSKESTSIIQKIRNMGHEIGLHYDETRYPTRDGGEDMLKQIQFEKNILEQIIGAEIRVISMHQPSKAFLNSNLKIPGMINSYSNDFFYNFKYCSDSMRVWHEDIQKDLAKKTYAKLHILTHPIWWAKEEIGRDETLRILLRARQNNQLEYFHQYYPEV